LKVVSGVMNKKRYRGKFTFNKKSYTLYKCAYSKRQAWLTMCREIAKKQGVDPFMVINYFDGSMENYSIEEEQSICRTTERNDRGT
jgi:hypothetical protein